MTECSLCGQETEDTYIILIADTSLVEPIDENSLSIQHSMYEPTVALCTECRDMLDGLFERMVSCPA